MSPLAVASVGMVLLASHWLAYEHGRSLELAQAVKLSALRDRGDRLAELISERSARREEQRRAARRKSQELMQRKNKDLLMLALLGPILLVSGCATKRESSPPTSVAPARIAPLSPEARQPPAPPWCSPNCSTGLLIRIESWRQHMTKPE